MKSKKMFSMLILLLILTAGAPDTLLGRTTVLASPADGPDLTVDGAVFFPAPIAGYLARLIVTVRNKGSDLKQLFFVTVKWGHCQIFNGTYGLKSGETTSILFYPLFLHAGNYMFELTVDPDGRVDETDETNNVYKFQQEVKLPKAGVMKAPTELDFETEEGVWGYVDNMPSGEPSMHALQDYGLMGRLNPNDPVSSFEAQGDTSACGTTSLAAILRYLSRKDSTIYNHDIVDKEIRGGGYFDIYSEGFSIARYASERGFEARVYVDGTFDDIKRFINMGIPVEMCITTSGSHGPMNVMDGHWIVAVCYWEDPNYGTMIGYYNPWGHLSAIPQSRFELYWTEQNLLGITLWNRFYVAICNRPAPPEMPPSNAGTLVNYYGALLQGVTVFLNALGSSLEMIESGDAWEVIKGLGLIIGSAIYGSILLVPVSLTMVGEWIWKGLKWIGEQIWEGIKALGCELFGWGCKSKKEYFYYFYSTSPSCECYRLLNDMIRNEAVGYIFTSQAQDGSRAPVYEYAEVDEATYEVVRYFVSTSPNLPETGVPGVRRFLYGELGYLPQAQIPNVPNEKLVDYLVKYGIGYDTPVLNLWVPQYYLEGSKILWEFSMSSETSQYAFLSPDEAGGTRTFPYVAVDYEGEKRGYHFTRDYVVGYIHCNHLRGTVPLYRFYDPDEEEFYLTTDLEDVPKEPGGKRALSPVSEMVFSGVVGYIFLEQKPGTVPLYKYYAHEKGADFLFTTKEIQSDKFTLLGVVGYVYEYEEECTTPLWLFCFRQVKEE
ncbi:MAG: CARDB domain-containing protein [Thermoproteota archaeon]